MKYRKLGKTGIEVSELSLGTWQIGGKWGSGFSDTTADRILNAAIDHGINFIDTADVYESGSSEKAVGRVVRSRSEKVYVATKCGRQINPHTSDNYTPEVLTNYVEESLKRTGLEALDLIQLHCPPPDVYYRPEIFATFQKLKDQGKIHHVGASVEKVEEGIKAMEYEIIDTIQIVFNLFRQRPAELFFEQAKKKNIGIIARVPLASGLLTGKFDKNTHFEEGDHRNFNRNGEDFDKGETFSGIPYQQGVEAVEHLKHIFPEVKNLAPIALQWILKFPEVSCVIPGASKEEQLKSNLSVYDLPDLSADKIQQMNAVYKQFIKQEVHQKW